MPDLWVEAGQRLRVMTSEPLVAVIDIGEGIEHLVVLSPEVV